MSHPERAADELQIRNLLASVAQLTDYGELEDYLDLYTEDGVWEMPDNTQVGVGASRRSGLEAIAAGVRERRAKGLQGPGSATIHVVTTTTVQFVGPATAVTSSFWMYYSKTDSVPVLQSIGHYEDTVRRTSRGWKLGHRRITAGGAPAAGWRLGAGAGAVADGAVPASVNASHAESCEAIRQLTARYNRAFDDRDVAGWLACFTPDGQIEIVDYGRVVAGHAELEKNIRTVTNTGRHTTTDFVIEVDGDRATQSCHLTELGPDEPSGKGFVIRRYGRYADQLVHDDGAWRFAVRQLRYG